MNFRPIRKSGGERGVTVMAFLGLMMVFSLFGLSLASIVTTSQETNSDHLYYDKAFYVGQTALEYAMRRIYEGVSPVVAEPGQGFSSGNFIIAREGRIVTVTARHGTSKVVHSVESPTEADCTVFDVTSASLTLQGKRLSQIQFRKICLEKTTLDKMVVSWTDAGSEALHLVRVENDTLYSEPNVPSNEMTELSDYQLLAQNNQNNFNDIRFTSDMTGKTFTMTFVMRDGSTAVHTFTPTGS